MKTYDLYTDTGGTILADGTKLGKDDVCVEAIGAMDEINSFLGIIYAHLADEYLKAMIDFIQRNKNYADLQCTNLRAEGRRIPTGRDFFLQ